MSEQRESARVKRQRHWTPTARETLIEYGYVDFLPEDYKIPTAIWAGRQPRVHRTHLKKISQLGLIQNWFGLTGEQWQEKSFRDSLRARYGSRDRKTIELLSPGDRLALSEVAQELVRKKTSSKSSSFEGKLLLAMQKRVILGILFRDSCSHILVNEYVRSLMPNAQKHHPWLNAPLSQGGLFRAVADREVHSWPFKRDMLESPTRWKYLCAGDGTLDAAIGQLTRDLMEVEKWSRRQQKPILPDDVMQFLPAWRSVQQMMLKEDYYAVASHYKKALKIPVSCFQKIELAFVALAVEELNQKLPVMSQSIFLAAALIRARHSRLFNHYREVLQGFKRQVESWSMTRSNDTAPDPVQEAERLSLRSMLDGDPLLRIVFHSEVLGGEANLRPKKPAGASPKRAKRLTAAVADRILHPYMKEISSRTVASMFQCVKRDRRLELLDGVKGSGYHQHVATLLNILFVDLDEKFTPQQIQAAAEEYGHSKEVRSLSEAPGPAFVAALDK